MTPDQVAIAIAPDMNRDYFSIHWSGVKDELIAHNKPGEPEGWAFLPNEYPAYDAQSSNPNRIMHYWRDGLRLDGLDGPLPVPPVGTRTLTIIVPPAPDYDGRTGAGGTQINPGGSPYNTICIAFRIKPSTANYDPATGSVRRLAVNFLDFSQQPDHEYVELANTTDKAINLKGWTLEVGIPDPVGITENPAMRDPFKSHWTIQEDAIIAPKGYLLLGFDKFDQFKAGGSNPSIYANGMGLANVFPNPDNPVGTILSPYAFVTEPPVGGLPTDINYGALTDATGSVFRRKAPSVTAGVVDTDCMDFVDSDGDGVSSAPLVHGSGSRGVAVAQDLELDTDNVATELKYHGDASGVVPPFARIVPLHCDYLWYATPATGGDPYGLDAQPVDMDSMNTTARIAELVLRGGVLPDYPEHDGHDNDGDGGYVSKDASVVHPVTGKALLRYVRGTLDKDMVDNNLDGRIDENGKETIDVNGNFVDGNPFFSEGVDEGRIELAAFPFKYRPRVYGYGSFEEGDLPFVYSPSVLAYGDWWFALYNNFVGNEANIGSTDTLRAFWAMFRPKDGIPLFLPGNGTFPAQLLPSNTVVSLFPQALPGQYYSTANWVYGVNAPGAGQFRETLVSEVGTGKFTSPEWKAFVERRWNPGDNVIVTLYVGPSAERKVADRATYRELDVTNRAVDDVVPSPYSISGYRNFEYLYDPSTRQGAAQWDGPDNAAGSANVVCLDRLRTHYWLPNQMGLDFYRSLERKHPLLPGDKYGMSNRWEATDGNYDDWSDSPGFFEAMEDRTQLYNPNSVAPADAGENQRTGTVESRFDRAISVPGTERLFRHAMSGSPLRMNAQQRLWDNPPDLVSYLVDDGKLSFLTAAHEVDGLSIGVDGGRRRQFVESDSGTTNMLMYLQNFEDRAYTLRRAEVRNRPFNSAGDLMTLPMLSFNMRLNPGNIVYDTSGNARYTWRSTNAAMNTHWLASSSMPVPSGTPAFWPWRQDTTLASALLATSADSSGVGTGFTGLTALTDMNAVVLTVGQARFRPIWPNPNDTNHSAPAIGAFDEAKHLHWRVAGAYPKEVRAPHCWTPVMLFADFKKHSQPEWACLPRWTVDYPMALPVGTFQSGALQWVAQPWLNPVDAPYLVQAEFLFDNSTRQTAVFGTLTEQQVNLRWPAARRYPPVATLPAENVEYPRAVMFVSQHDDSLGETGRAEGIFSWDANDGLENGTYIAYVATFVPRMGQSLWNADRKIMEVPDAGSTVPKYPAALLPHWYAPGDTSNPPTEANWDPITNKILSLDPMEQHGDGDDHFEPVLALEFLTDPSVAGRVAPPRADSPPAAPRIAALPHPADWLPSNNFQTSNSATIASTAAAYRADGDGMILYSGTGGVTWKARLVRVTDNFLALRVRNLGRPDQVACITGVVLAPAGHVAGKVNVNTVENERIISAIKPTTYTFSVFNTLLGLPGVVDALSTVRNPLAPSAEPDRHDFIGFRQGPETPMGWPERTDVPRKSPTGDLQREAWLAPNSDPDKGFLPPAAGDAVFMPPRVRTNPDGDPNLLAPLAYRPTSHTDWVGSFEGVAALRLSSMMMANRTEHYDGRCYDYPAGLITGAGQNGRLNVSQFPYPLSNESVPEWRFDEIEKRFGRMANLITTRSDVFEILVTVQAGEGTDVNGDGQISYRDTGEFTVTAESQGRVIYERRARTDRSDEAAVLNR